MIVVSLTGRLTRNPELRHIESEGEGGDVCDVRIAAKDSRGGTVFLDCKQWGPGGRAAAEHLRKGSLVAFTGEVRQREAEINGTQRQFFSAVGRIEFLATEPSARESPPVPV
jgi:single-stranded DNA-binding protein